uniref:Hyccin n=1 Tax=Musa acuminata subsp. malaccensis TaxID=214687 RepID=A0A804HXQ8_MUSAM
MSADPVAPAESSAFWQSVQRAQAAVQSLYLILGSLPDAVASSENPAAALLNDEAVAREVSIRLRRHGSGAGDDNLCRWLYDTFQSNDPDLQLVVLTFTPTIAGVYLLRAISREPLAGFEAVLLALYAYETVIRGGDPETVNLPNLANPSVYHEAKAPPKKGAVELDTAVVSPALEPYGTVRSTKRARIVGVALELYYSKISSMPLSSKLAFCEFCMVWAGQDIGTKAEGERSVSGPAGIAPAPAAGEVKAGRIPLPWELFQPIVRIVGHCLLGPANPEELKTTAYAVVERLHWRATHDMNPQEILATRSLLRLGKMGDDTIAEPQISTNSDDYSEEALKMNARLT